MTESATTVSTPIPPENIEPLVERFREDTDVRIDIDKIFLRQKSYGSSESLAMIGEIAMMAELPVGRVEEFEEADRKIVLSDATKVGVFRVDERFYAYENRCMHQGGPVCEGRILGKVEAVLEDDRNVLREKFSDTEKHLVCPWHGYEYDIRTGQHSGDRRLRLNRFDVIERDGMVYLLVEQSDGPAEAPGARRGR